MFERLRAGGKQVLRLLHPLYLLLATCYLLLATCYLRLASYHSPLTALLQVFILTNSLYDFTNVVMSFLLGDDWKDHLDLVICGARKPG